uniref:Uncharacterized protein n=1 Tax=Amphimedon queenslandica TaxID=400682 RepID=A0A1X7SSE3_AMPQE
EVRKRKQNEDHDGSSTSKRFKISGNDTTAETTFTYLPPDETRKRKLNEDQDDSLTIKKFKVFDNIDATETETTTEQKSSSSLIAKLQSEIQKIKNENETFKKQKKALILENERLKSLAKDHNAPVEQKEETEILQETETVHTCTYISKG